MGSELVAKIAAASAPYAIDRPYDYLVPPELEGRALPGVRVLIPFGAGNRTCDGVILAVGEGSRHPKLKSILTVLDDAPMLDAHAISLALWMSRRCFCTVYDCVRAMLPAGLWFALRDSYRIAPGVDREAAYDAAGRSPAATQLVELLFANNGAAPVGTIRAALGVKDPNPILKRLTDRGIITSETGALRGVGDKSERVAVLTASPEEALAQASRKRASAPMRYAVLELLCGVGEASVKELGYFTGASMQTLRSLEKSGLIALEEREVLRTVDIGAVEPAAPVELSPEQQRAFERLNDLCAQGKPAAALLYGVTGSGKTQVYIKLIEQTLARGKTALILVPEIALTPQLLRIFIAHFGDNVAVLHSSLRAGERYDAWKRVRAGTARVVLGTRSAVFAPLSDIGLIVMDEEQEGTYKSEQSPRYHARDVAKYRAAAYNALLLLGSATPAVESMYAARAGTYHLLELGGRYNRRALPEVLIADMKGELRAGNGTSISALLRHELEENILKGEQSILFLNRRGANRMVTCGECGAVPTCPRCTVYLTYHTANNRLMCHHCGHSERLPDTCPQCGGKLSFIGAGTQKVEEELKQIFPAVGVMRMDTDAVSASQSHEVMLQKFEREQIPILVGTQMVAKGLDFPNVTLVGVIAADLALYVDDFRAAERTFSLLTQVVGRAGRGDKSGRAVIQTYTPDNEVITFAAAQDYDSFYAQEIRLRELRGCPPLRDLFVFTASGLEEGAVLRACHRLRAALEQALTAAAPWTVGAQLLGPAPASVAKVNLRFRYRLTLACRADNDVRALVAHIVRAAQADKENRGVSIFADCNPNN